MKKKQSSRVCSTCVSCSILQMRKLKQFALGHISKFKTYDSKPGSLEPNEYLHDYLSAQALSWAFFVHNPTPVISLSFFFLSYFGHQEADFYAPCHPGSLALWLRVGCGQWEIKRLEGGDICIFTADSC